MIYITRKNAVLFYKASLDNPNISVDRMIEEFYKSINKTPEEIEIIIKNSIDRANKLLDENGVKKVDFPSTKKVENNDSGKIIINMSLLDIIMTMSEGNLGAMTVLTQMTGDSK